MPEFYDNNIGSSLGQGFLVETVVVVAGGAVVVAPVVDEGAPDVDEGAPDVDEGAPDVTEDDGDVGVVTDDAAELAAGVETDAPVAGDGLGETLGCACSAPKRANKI
ncbi:hypothetical protein Y032_0250g140 [Ancylostoma ceylanicum]|uniref:Uncharacterized protein n=1 Tax=Ancylostoma ceylanicum TaxID=53326 RepID=A0A016SCX8_9BILA|nr:hypothetical protein Y032_0250g140 [Ancylostoma ceylanicum]